VLGIEAAVKDTTRYAATGGWAYLGFGGSNGLAESATPNPPTASCYACHRDNTAVENTFVQFYPTLFEVAQTDGHREAHLRSEAHGALRRERGSTTCGERGGKRSSPASQAWRPPACWRCRGRRARRPKIA
jgi:hypothetical protein